MTPYKAKVVSNDLQKKIKLALPQWTQCHVEEGDGSIAICWRFKQCRIHMYIYTFDAGEGIRITLQTPREFCERQWREISGKSIDDIIDTVASFATLAVNQKD